MDKKPTKKIIKPVVIITSLLTHYDNYNDCCNYLKVNNYTIKI